MRRISLRFALLAATTVYLIAYGIVIYCLNVWVTEPTSLLLLLVSCILVLAFIGLKLSFLKVKGISGRVLFWSAVAVFAVVTLELTDWMTSFLRTSNTQNLYYIIYVVANLVMIVEAYSLAIRLKKVTETNQ